MRTNLFINFRIILLLSLLLPAQAVLADPRFTKSYELTAEVTVDAQREASGQQIIDHMVEDFKSFTLLLYKHITGTDQQGAARSPDDIPAIAWLFGLGIIVIALIPVSSIGLRHLSDKAQDKES